MRIWYIIPLSPVSHLIFLPTTLYYTIYFGLRVKTKILNKLEMLQLQTTDTYSAPRGRERTTDTHTAIRIQLKQTN